MLCDVKHLIDLLQRKGIVEQPANGLAATAATKNGISETVLCLSCNLRVSALLY
jgi:hypothetical protein